MEKRKRSASSETDDAISAPKRLKSGHQRNLLNLSDELALKVLSFLPVSDLVVVQRVSRRLQQLSNDGEIWKEKYYSRWVQPRARRIPGARDGDPNLTYSHSSKLSKWLNHSHLLRGEMPTDWKRQYRISSNWFRGKSRKREVEIARPPVSPVIVKIHQGIIYTVDVEHGLRAWSKDSPSRPLCSHVFEFGQGRRPVPTSLGIDHSNSDKPRLVVGFSDGSFKILLHSSDEFVVRHYHRASSRGPISAVAIAEPYVLTISNGREMALYRLLPSSLDQPETPGEYNCTMLASLRSEIKYESMSLSVRKSKQGLTACIAYAFCRLNSGWLIGLQELRLNEYGGLEDCRLASTIGTNSGQSTRAARPMLFSSILDSISAPHPQPQLKSCPTSLSYTHPYLVATLPDNTLIVYLVTSNRECLQISSGRRLWGHTSSVSGAEVNDRGKAVTVSTKGDEIRVWELEDIITSSSHRRSSIRIDPVPDLGTVAEAIARRGNGLGLAVRGLQDELAIKKTWVGFDEEQVVVLGEHYSKQVLSCYDFT